MDLSDYARLFRIGRDLEKGTCEPQCETREGYRAISHFGVHLLLWGKEKRILI